MPNVPGFANASVHPNKIIRYLFVPLPKDDKSRFLFNHGFTLANSQQVNAALLDHVTVNQVIRQRPISDWNDPTGNTIAGYNYEVRCTFQTPDGANPCIRTVWTVLIGHGPTFQTLIPRS